MNSNSEERPSSCCAVAVLYEMDPPSGPQVDRHAESMVSMRLISTNSHK
eukprot:COSAG01_NODE_76192_length_189_cov_17.966667_1_plen_48_part_10